MDFVPEFTDEDAPEFVVTHVISIERITANTVRITKGSEHRNGVRAVFHEVWDLQGYCRWSKIVKETMDYIARLPVEDGPGEVKRQAAN